MFISFEGSEGSGKTSQILPLAEYLRESGYDVLMTREPGGTPISDRIREILFDLSNQDMNERTEILLFQASRAQLIEQVIIPHLDQGSIVLCDRYADSTIAYQGFGYQRDIQQLKSLVNFATRGLKPDLTLLFDVDIEEGLRRRKKGGKINRLDTFQLEFYQRVREGYYRLAQEEPERWVIIDAGRPIHDVEKTVRKVVLERLEKARRSHSP